MITKINLKKFTVFESLKVNFSPGVNIIIGANGTGKTHLMKVIYTAIAANNEGKRISDKIVDVFLPKNRNIGRLVKRQQGSSSSIVWIRMKSYEKEGVLRISFSNHTKDFESGRLSKHSFGKIFLSSHCKPLKRTSPCLF